MTEQHYIWLFVSILLFIFTVMYVFSYLGINQKYYYIVLVNYVILFIYFYYKYRRYSIDLRMLS